MVWVTVDLDMSEIDTDDLIEELEARGEYKQENSFDAQQELIKIWELRRLGKPYEAELDAYIYHILGKVI